MPVDYDALAKKYGGQLAPPAVPDAGSNLDALAAKYGGTGEPGDPQGPPQPPVDPKDPQAVKTYLDSKYPKPPGFLQQFGTGLANTVKGIYDTGKRMIVPPEDTAGKVAKAVAGPLGPVVVDAAQAHIATGKKAVEAAKQGDYSSAAGYGLATALPGIGPAAAAEGEKLGEGKYGEVAGDIVGAVAVPKALSKVKSVTALPKFANPNLAERRATVWARQRGINVPAGQATGNTFVKYAQKVADTSPVGSVIGDIERQNLADQMANTGRELAGQANVVRPQNRPPRPGPMMVPETAGDFATGRVEKVIGDLRNQADLAYDEWRTAMRSPQSVVKVQTGTKTVEGFDPNTYEPVTQQVPTYDTVQAPVNLSSLKPKLKPLFEEMQWMPAAERSASSAYTALKKILDGPDVISAEQAERGLSGLKEMARTDTPNVRNVSQGTAASIVPELQDLIDASTARYGGGRALGVLRRGRAMHADKMQAAEVLDKMRDEPVQLFNQATYAGDAGIKQLRSVANIAPEVLPQIGRAYLEKLVQKATREGGFRHGQSLFGDWQNLGPSTKKLLFRDQGYINDLDNYFQTARMLSEEVNPSQTAVVGHSLSNAGLIVASPATGIPYALGMGAMSKLFHSRYGVQLLARGMKIPVGNRAAGAAVASEILKIAGGEAKPLPAGQQPKQLPEPAAIINVGPPVPKDMPAGAPLAPTVGAGKAVSAAALIEHAKRNGGNPDQLLKAAEDRGFLLTH